MRPFKTSAVDKTVSSKEMQNESSEVNYIYILPSFFHLFQLFWKEKGNSNVEIVRTCTNDKKLTTFWITAGGNKFFGGNIRRELINDLKLKKEKISTGAVHFFVIMTACLLHRIYLCLSTSTDTNVSCIKLGTDMNIIKKRCFETVYLLLSLK